MPNEQVTIMQVDVVAAAVTRLDQGLRFFGGISPDDVDNNAVRIVLDALAARTREVEELRAEIAEMTRFDAESTELLDWLMAHLSFQEWQRLGVPDPRRPRTRGDLLAVRSRALAAQEGT